MRSMKLVASAACAVALTTAAHAKTQIIVLPPDYPGGKETLVAQLARAVGALSPADELLVFAAPGPTQLARIAIPTDARAQNPAWKKRQLGRQFQPVMRYIGALREAPVNQVPPENLMIPNVLDEIGRNVTSSLPDQTADILLVGSWLYFDPRDERWSMMNGFYPSDGLIGVGKSESPFGTDDARERLQGLTVHYCWPEGQSSFVSEEHEEVVRRETSLWTAAQSGRAGTFSFDLVSCMDRLLGSEASGQTAYELAADSKPEMLRARVPLPATLPSSFDQPGEWFLRDDVPISHTPPMTTTGVAWIGLKWSAACDVDLYARPEGSRQWLFYGRVRTEDGYFNKDFLSATGESQFEFIEFNRPIDLTKGEVAINLYSGELSAGPEGVIRVWFGGQVYEAPFKLEANSGNGGAFPMSGSHWVKIDLQKVVGLIPS